MPNDHGQSLTVAQQFNQQLDEQVKNFRALLPSHIPVEKFKRVVVVAISQNPNLLQADRRSLFTAAQKCAADGLLPDGRQAALVVYGNQVAYMPMIAGIRQRMRNSGEVLSSDAQVVYRNDKFFQKFGDDPAIVHEPPAFGVDRGEPVGAYAIIKLKNGEILREVLDKKEIEKIRSVSKSKNGPAWTVWWAEMARKSALRRCAKAAPTSADIDDLLARDDDPGEMPMVDITPPETEPPRGAALTHQPAPEGEPDPSYVVTDNDGELHEFDQAQQAIDLLQTVMATAARRGPSHIEAARENNAELIAEFAVPSATAGLDAVHAAEIIDPETGEILDAAEIEREARAAAEQGTHVFRGYLRGITREARAILNGKVGTREAPGELLVVAMRADDEARAAADEPKPHSPAGAPVGTNRKESHAESGTKRSGPGQSKGDSQPEPTQSAPAGETINDMFGGAPRHASLRAHLPEQPTMKHWDEWLFDLQSKIKDGYPKADIMRDNKDNIGIFEGVDEMRYEALIRALEAR